MPPTINPSISKEREMIEFLKTNNSTEFNITKLLEELSELQVALLEKLNKIKKGDEYHLPRIEEEMAHVKLRMQVLEESLNLDTTEEEYKKIEDLYKYKDKIEYYNQI